MHVCSGTSVAGVSILILYFASEYLHDGRMMDSYMLLHVQLGAFRFV